VALDVDDDPGANGGRSGRGQWPTFVLGRREVVEVQRPEGAHRRRPNRGGLGAGRHQVPSGEGRNVDQGDRNHGEEHDASDDLRGDPTAEVLRWPLVH
jgi:hypothetical protein